MAQWKLPADHAHVNELHVGGMIYRVEGGIVQDVDERHAGQLRGVGATRMTDGPGASADAPGPVKKK